MKLSTIKRITGKIEVLTGLHIGASKDTIEIGGMDNPVIKNPITGEPYIPGSSLKGKMRALMELLNGNAAKTNGEPCSCGKCDICKVFGCSASTGANSGPTRLIVRDCFLTGESKEKFIEETVLEEKHENKINRITAEAKPRPIERVIPGTTFDFEINFRVFEGDDPNLLNNILLKAMRLLEHDYLGGGGSRGNGKIKFIDLKDESGKSITLPEV